MFFSPLEQFEILPLLPITISFLDFSITNQTIMLALIVFFLVSIFFIVVKQSNSSLFIVPHRFQIVLELLYSMILGIVVDNISGRKAQLFFPLIFTIFFFAIAILKSLKVGCSPSVRLYVPPIGAIIEMKRGISSAKTMLFFAFPPPILK